MFSINGLGLIVIMVIMIPNVIFALTVQNHCNHCQNRWMNGLEQIGRYGCFSLMIVSVQETPIGFQSIESLMIYLVLVSGLLLLYFIFWGLYFSKRFAKLSIWLAIIPCIIFMVSGLFMAYYVLFFFGVLFAIGHIYVSYCNIYTK